MADTTIGYAVLQIIPSLEGVSKEIDKQLGGTLTASGKRGGKQFAKGLGEGLKSAEAEVRKATDAYEKLRDKAADALGKVRTEEEKLAKARTGGKTDQIVAAEERLAKARRDSARANKDSASAHSSLLDAQKRVGDSAGDLGGKMTGLGASMGAMAGVAAGAAVTGLTALGAGAIKAGRELYDLGAQFDDLRDKLQIDTGATDAQLDGLVDSIKKLGTTTVASSFADIGDIAVDVTRNLHLTGPAFEQVTSRLANLSRMTGEAVNIRELGKAFRGFGVDAADQAGALNSLYEASTKSGLSVNDMVASVVKAGPALRQFGLSFGESAALVNTFEEAGVDADKTIATLNKAFAYFADKGIPAKQGLQGVVQQIQALIAAGDEAGAADLTNKVFGARGGVNFFDLIKSGAVDLASLSSSLQSTGVDINRVAADTADWAERWQILKNKASEALEPLAAGIFDFVNENLDSLATWVETHQTEIIDFFVAVGDFAIGTADAIHGFVASTIHDMGLLVDIADKIVGAMATVDEFLDKIPGFKGDQSEAAKLRDIQHDLQDVSKSLKNTSSDVDAARDAWGNLKDTLHAAGEEAKTSSAHIAALGEKIAAVPKERRGWFDVPTTSPGSASNSSTVLSGNAAALPAGLAPSKGLTAGAENLNRVVSAQFPQLASTGGIGGWRPPDGFNEHSSGEALDIMVGNNKALGDEINRWLLANADQLGLQYTLWQQTQWNPGGGSSPMVDRGNPTQNHMDHVHARVKPGGGKGGNLLAALAPPQPGTPIAAVGPTGPAASSPAIDLSRNIKGPETQTTVTGPTAHRGGGFSLPSSLSGIGSAIGEFAGGQIGSALSVLGIPDSPSWLQGLSQFVGGISIGGDGSAAPLSLGPSGMGTIPPDDAGSMHGTRAGAQPGPTFNTTIQARDAEDALEQWRRYQNQLAAAKLSRF